MYKKTTLPNGLRIIDVPSKDTNTVTVLVMVATGSKYESKEISGISHFLEHMALKGTKKRPTEMEIFRLLDSFGGIWNAFTSPDFTGYYIKSQSDKFHDALELVSDIYLNSTLPASEVEKERGTIIEELNMFYDHPMRYIGTLWNKVLYGDQPAGWDIGGTIETIKKISRNQLISYRNSQYVARNTIVCISGNFNQSKALKLIKKHFSGISLKKPINKNTVIDRQKAPQVIIYEKATEQVETAIGVRAYNNKHPQKYAFELLNLMLGGMCSSRLMEEIRVKRGLAYDVHTELNMDPDVGSLVAVANLNKKRLEEGIKIIINEFKKISKNKVSVLELKKAKDHYIGKYSIALESSHAQASFYAEQELLEGEILEPKEIFKKILKVKISDIHEISQLIFKPEKLNLALIGPFKNKEKFNKLLKI